MSGFLSYHCSLISYHLLRNDLNRPTGRSVWLAALMFLTSCGAGDDRPASEISNIRPETEYKQLSGTAESININTAGLDELRRIPHVGTSIAEKIIEHREKHGPFKRPEDLMLIQGINDVRYRRIRHLIRVE